MKLKNKNLIIPFILAALQFLHIVDFMLIMPLGNELMKVFQISPAEFSQIVGSYGYAAAFSSLFGAFVIDRFDRKKSVIFITIGFIIGTLFCGLSDGYAEMLTARIVTGIFGGMVNAIIFTIVGDLYEIDRRSTVMGYIAAAFSVASAFGVPIGLTIADLYDWHIPFIVLGISTAPILIMLILFLPEMDEHLISSEKKKTPFDIIGDLFKRRNQQLALLFILSLVLSQFIVIPFITPYFVRNVGLPQEYIKYIYLAGGLATMITGPLIGRYASKKGRQAVFYRMTIISLLPIFLITQLPELSLWIVLLPSTLFFIFISGRMIPAQALMTSVVLPKNRGSFMSLSSSMMQLGIGLSTFLSGAIVTKQGNKLLNYDIVGYISLGITILVIFLATKLTTEEKKEEQNNDETEGISNKHVGIQGSSSLASPRS